MMAVGVENLVRKKIYITWVFNIKTSKTDIDWIVLYRFRSFAGFLFLSTISVFRG